MNAITTLQTMAPVSWVAGMGLLFYGVFCRAHRMKMRREGKTEGTEFPTAAEYASIRTGNLLLLIWVALILLNEYFIA